jgi:hypothetical protein
VNFRNKLIFYSEELLTPRPTPKLEDHPLSAVRDCLLNIFAATIHIWRPSRPYIFSGDLEVKRQLRDLGIDGGIVLKHTLKKQVVRM